MRTTKRRIFRAILGVVLTVVAALGVVRRHRLVELCLVEVLGYSWDEVHEEAERIEHAVSEEFVDRMEKLLGHPEVDAHGSPIPTKDGEVVERPDVPLAGLGVGERAMVSRGLDRNAEALRHLTGMGLRLGVELEVVERHPFDGPLILNSGGESLVVSRILALLVFVEHIPVRREGNTGLPRRVTLAKGTR